MKGVLTFLAEGSVTPLTMLLSSFLIVLAATPVVAERKSCVSKGGHEFRERGRVIKKVVERLRNRKI
jgi:hypothetical protein